MTAKESLDIRRRFEVLQFCEGAPWDLTVIGGGITGAGIALDAASRGLKVLLVEMDDFASGTSSRSTKLIHGGLRYLKQFEFRLVAEVGRERAILHKNASHLVIPEKMLLPVVKGGTFSKGAVSFGLWVYDLLAGVKRSERRKMLSLDEVLALEPALNPEGYQAAGLYTEYRTDDARLTMSIVRKATESGAFCLNYNEVTDFLYDGRGKIIGVKAFDHHLGLNVVFRSKVVVSAAGPWVDRLRAADQSLGGKRLHHTKGVHLVVKHERLPIHQSVYFDIPDGRMMFAIPRRPWTYIGTTDTEYKGSLSNPQASSQDVQYLLEATNRFFPEAKLAAADLISSWAGIRPLIHEEGKSASQLSRKDEVFISTSGLISIAGGKLTGYRKMAEKVVDIVVRRLHKIGFIRSKPSSKTRNMVLPGGHFDRQNNLSELPKKLAAAFGIPVQEAEWVVGLFGSESAKVLQRQNGPLDKVGIVKAALRFCVEEEAVTNLSDFLIRRTALLYFGRPWIAPVLAELDAEIRTLVQNVDHDVAWTEFMESYESVVRFLPEEIAKS